VLAGENMVILDSITITGADGYNTAIIPVLEALGCNPLTIKSYNYYKNHAYGDGVLKNVLDPVFDKLDKLADKPVQTIVDILPNVVYFMESGSLEKCISNLLLPITSMINRVPGVIDFNVDVTELTKSLDLNTGMFLVRTSGVSNGLHFAEFTTDGIFVPLYAIADNSVFVVENGVAVARNIVVARQDSENAYIKASEISKFTNKVVIADDSGLVVDAYPKLLGVYSHRFLENEPYSVKNAELIKMVEGKIRTGRYICVICVMNLLDKPIFFEGRFEGTIAYEPKGNNGFGYDPIFIPEGYDKTVAELSNEEKNQMSHRGIASRKLVDFLNSMK
jgi:XTP/dITP diphosphohydrolase